MYRKYSCNLLAATLLCVLLSLTAHAEKTDVVILVNGNSVTGEIKVLEFGALRYRPIRWVRSV